MVIPPSGDNTQWLPLPEEKPAEGYGKKEDF
jgi:hypothetical protein